MWQVKACRSTSAARTHGGISLQSLLGAATYGVPLPNNPDWMCPWSFVDALYFVMTTLSTVGYGDLTVADGDARRFLMFYAVTGLMVFASFATVCQRTFSAASNRVVKATTRLRLSATRQKPSVRAHVLLYARALTLTCLFFGIHVSSACVFAHLEDWSFVTAFYHCIITATTIGYGDTTIKTDEGRLWASIHILISTMYFAALLGVIGSHMELIYEERKRHKLISHCIDNRFLDELRGTHDHLGKYEYVVGMRKPAQRPTRPLPTARQACTELV